MLSIADFLNDPHAPVRKAAAMIASYQTELSSGQITQAEFDDLCRDVTDLSLIDQDTLKIGELKMIEDAFNALRAIVSAASAA